MSPLGQNAKYSSRVDAFRFAPDNRHAVTAPRRRFVPIAAVACDAKGRPAWISSIDAAMPPVVSSRRRCCARVKRVDVALGRAAGSRRPALVYRKVAAVLEIESYPDDVHANRIMRVIRLRLGRRGRRNHPRRQNRQSQHAHQNLPRDRRHSINAPKQTNHIDLSQFALAREEATVAACPFGVGGIAGPGNDIGSTGIRGTPVPVDEAVHSINNGSRRRRFAAPFSLPGASAQAIASMCVLPNAPLRSQGAALK